MLVNFVISQRVFLSKDAVRVSRSSLATLFHKLTFFVMNIHINYFKLSMFMINMMKISWNKTFPIFIIIINIIIINSLKWKQIQRVWTRKEKKNSRYEYFSHKKLYWFKLISEALPFKLLYKTRIEKQ